MKVAHALVLCKLFLAYQFLNYWFITKELILIQLQALISNANYIKKQVSYYEEFFNFQNLPELSNELSVTLDTITDEQKLWKKIQSTDIQIHKIEQ